MPKDTYKDFTRRQKKDHQLQTLQQELNRDDYILAKQKIANVQKHKNPLTGLSSEDYEQNLLRHLKALLFDNT